MKSGQPRQRRLTGHPVPTNVRSPEQKFDTPESPKYHPKAGVRPESADPSKNSHSQNLRQFLISHDAHWRISETPQHFPCIEVKLPELKTPYPPLVCDNCGDLMKPVLKTTEFPFARTGVVIRFDNVLYYICDKCGIEDSPEDNTQGVIIGETLHNVTTQPIKQVKLALEPTPQ